LIGHMADTHLRDTQYASVKRGQDFRDAFFAALGATLPQVDMLVLVGDIFDKTRPSPAMIGQLMEADEIIRRAGKACLAVTGNHDMCDPTWLSTLFPGRDGTSVGIVPVDGRAIEMCGLKFVGLPPMYAKKFRDDIVSTELAVSDADVVLFHGMVDGVVPFFSGLDSPLHVSELPVRQSNAAWLLGDVHVQGYVSAQRPDGGTCLVGYPGSTEMCSSSEPPDKSVPIVLVQGGVASVYANVPVPSRKFVGGTVKNDEDLDALMARLVEVKDEHPLVVVKFDRAVANTVGRIHSVLDAQRSTIRCSPLPVANPLRDSAREDMDAEHDILGIDHFVGRRFDDNLELRDFAMSLLTRGDSDASSLAADYVEMRLAAAGVREED
jgi:DNA repair exonuclease SbcCD nuclease subunit